MMEIESEATASNILAFLQTMYWKGVKREVCEAILACHEIEQISPGLSAYETAGRNSDLSGINFKKFCAMLSEYATASQTTIRRSPVRHARKSVHIEILGVVGPSDF
jgi:hypothetical protein